MGNEQFILHYDVAKVDNLPQSFEELRRWTEDNPGRFTYPEVTDFTGNAFVCHLSRGVATCCEVVSQ